MEGKFKVYKRSFYERMFDEVGKRGSEVRGIV